MGFFAFGVSQKLLEDMEAALGVWRALLLPLTSDPELPAQMKLLQSSLKGMKITVDMLKVRDECMCTGSGFSSNVKRFNLLLLFLQVILSAAPLLSRSDLQSLCEGACLHDGDFLKLLQKSVCELKWREEPRGHTVLILDKVGFCSSPMEHALIQDGDFSVCVCVAVSSEAAMGEHLVFKASFCHSYAFTARCTGAQSSPRGTHTPPPYTCLSY